MHKREIELLAPAADCETAIQAILHGADAVYIGGPSFGARASVGNNIEDIAELCDFAHQFCARVYVTVNTIIYDNELSRVEKMCWQLYQAGVDALIIQDMALLKLNLPPIALHASTQCDTRTPEKAKWLEDIGMSQIVLARELSVSEIQNICESVTVPIETFVHGALCVSYSGRCHASYFTTGRSANRGECSQICRMKYSLIDSNKKIIARDKYLLSLKDFNASEKLFELIEAGVRSFKIEGRLKDISYVKNVTAAYRTLIDKILENNSDRYKRSSEGVCEINFSPNLHKSFNRGFSEYFLNCRNPQYIASVDTPKSLGEPLKNVSQLNNGDGVSFFNHNGEYDGFKVQRIVKGRIIPFRNVSIPKDAQLFRTNDVEWKNKLTKPTAERKIWVDFILFPNRLMALDERGCKATVALELPDAKACKRQDPGKVLRKLGNTIYNFRNLENYIPEHQLIPNSILATARKNVIGLLDKANRIRYKYESRRLESFAPTYPTTTLDYRDNVSNELSREFYTQHGVENIEPALECQDIRSNKTGGRKILMTTRHCVLRELGMCKKKAPRIAYKSPLFLATDKFMFELLIDCNKCENQLLSTR